MQGFSHQVSDTLRMRVWGERACFTRPEMKVERVSYDVMTPSAARGVLEAVLWKPQMRWIVERIDVLKPVRKASVRRNEVGQKASVDNLLISDGRPVGKAGLRHRRRASTARRRDPSRRRLSHSRADRAYRAGRSGRFPPEICRDVPPESGLGTVFSPALSRDPGVCRRVRAGRDKSSRTHRGYPRSRLDALRHRLFRREADAALFRGSARCRRPRRA